MTRGKSEGEDQDTVIVERSGAGGIIVAVLLAFALLLLLHYFGLLPI